MQYLQFHSFRNIVWISFCAILFLQSKSSEIIPVDLPENLIRKINLNAAFAKKMCGELKTFGIKVCAEIESRNAAAIKDCPLYAVIGKHALILEISPGKYKYFNDYNYNTLDCI